MSPLESSIQLSEQLSTASGSNSFAKEEELSYRPKASHRSPLRVLLDARKLGHGGIGVYIENIIHALIEHTNTKLSLIVNPESISNWNFPQHIELISDKARSYSLDELLLMPGRIDFKQFDLFHTPHFSLPFKIPIPSVITVHDLIHIHYPERMFYPLLAKLAIRSALKRASLVLTVSHASRRDILRLDPSIDHKLSIISNSFDPVFLEQKRLSPDTRKRLGLGSSAYFVSVFSNTKPHKGLSDLISAYGKLSERRSLPALVLVGAGATSCFIPDRLKHSVHCVGEVTRFELAELYGSAEALIVASHIEGFCLPALEAKASGIKIIARPVPAVLELLDQNDIRAHDMSATALMRAIERFSDQMRANRALSPNRGSFKESAREDDQQEKAVANSNITERFGLKSLASTILEAYQRVVAAESTFKEDYVLTASLSPSNSKF